MLKKSTTDPHFSKREPTCNIEWITNRDDDALWQDDFATCARSNILQAPQYADVAARRDKLKVRRGYVMIGSKKAGMVQIFENSILFGLFHVITLDRGPLWFEGFGQAADIGAFFQCFGRLYPARRGRTRRILPELANGFAAQAIIKQCGLSQDKEYPPYQTYWLDLREDKETLWDRLGSSWRKNIKRALKNDLTLEWDLDGKYLDWILGHYQAEKSEKQYHGPPSAMLRDLSNSFDHGHTLIVRALHQGRPVAGIMIILHGTSATYQMACRKSGGRNSLSLHHYMLWEGIQFLKERSYTDFDLGGIHHDMPEGLQHFKKAAGGRLITLAGLFR